MNSIKQLENTLNVVIKYVFFLKKWKEHDNQIKCMNDFKTCVETYETYEMIQHLTNIDLLCGKITKSCKPQPKCSVHVTQDKTLLSCFEHITMTKQINNKATIHQHLRRR